MGIVGIEWVVASLKVAIRDFKVFRLISSCLIISLWMKGQNHAFQSLLRTGHSPIGC